MAKAKALSTIAKTEAAAKTEPARGAGKVPDAGPDGSSPAAASPDLVATVQYMTFEPGLFAVDVVADHVRATSWGLALPCIRIEAIPPTASRPGRATVVDQRHTGWLSRSEGPAIVVVVGGRAGAILTIYRGNDGMAAPEIRITHIPANIGGAPTGAQRPAGPAPVAHGASRPETPEIGNGDRVPLGLLAHVTRVGDVTKASDGWIGEPGSGKAIEGFAVTPGSPLHDGDLEYQAILGNSWDTPWFSGGEFCGSRGLQLPLLGFRARLTGDTTEYDCVYSGRFVGGMTSGPHRNGEACHAGDAPLEAFEIVISKRGARAPLPPATAAAYAADRASAPAFAPASAPTSAPASDAPPVGTRQKVNRAPAEPDTSKRKPPVAARPTNKKRG